MVTTPTLTALNVGSEDRTVQSTLAPVSNPLVSAFSTRTNTPPFSPSVWCDDNRRLDSDP